LIKIFYISLLLISADSFASSFVDDFYQLSDKPKIWHIQSIKSFKSAAIQLHHDGLPAESYWTKDFDQIIESKQWSKSQDKQLSRAYLLALTHLRWGRIDKNSLSIRRDIKLTEDNAGLLRAYRAVQELSIPQLFNRMRPDNLWYERMRHRLRIMRGEALVNNNTPISKGEILEPGDSDQRIPSLAKRLSINVSDSLAYSGAIVDAVRRFQFEHGLDDDGVLGPATLRAMNQPPQFWIDRLKLGLERLRWLHDLPSENFIFVDIAGFKVTYMQNARSRWETDAQVGSAWRKTPVFDAKISYLVFNPEWTVPPGIFKSDILPKIKEDIVYLEDNNMYLVDPEGTAVDPKSIDWENYSLKANPVIVKQQPGENNSLGQLKFMFPNPYNVYLHDTPHKEHFSERLRAFSSGCIRLENPKELANLLLQEQGWSMADIDKAIQNKTTKTIGLKSKIPVILFYGTINPLNMEFAQFYPDIYNRDTKLLDSLYSEKHQHAGQAQDTEISYVQ